MPLPLGAKPPHCPSCRKRMTSVVGTQANGAPVYACAFCLTIKTRGKLKYPETPRWHGDPGKAPKPRSQEDVW